MIDEYFNLNKFLNSYEDAEELDETLFEVTPIKPLKGKVTCLSCENRFTPVNKYNKLCKSCKLENGVDD